jgi:phytoene dehydrogenase-like protein
MVRVCNFDETLAPKGKTSVIVHLRTTDPQYWIDLRKRDRARYAAEKKRAADGVISTLERRYGDVAAKVEVVDVCTPATIVRYTNNWQAAYQGWAPTPELIGRSLPRTIDGVRCFYMCGQWVDPPGGLPRVIISARMAVQTLCRDRRQPFVSRSASE